MIMRKQPAAATEEVAEEEAGPVDDYLELLEGQGEYAPAYDFFTTSMFGQSLLLHWSF